MHHLTVSCQQKSTNDYAYSHGSKMKTTQFDIRCQQRSLQTDIQHARDHRLNNTVPGYLTFQLITLSDYSTTQLLNNNNNNNIPSQTKTLFLF
jgi:hypothetical protein